MVRKKIPYRCTVATLKQGVWGTGGGGGGGEFPLKMSRDFWLRVWTLLVSLDTSICFYTFGVQSYSQTCPLTIEVSRSVQRCLDISRGVQCYSQDMSVDST